MITVHPQTPLDPDTLAVITSHTTLEKLLASGLAIIEMRNADEFSIDAVVRLEDALYLVYHLT